MRAWGGVWGRIQVGVGGGFSVECEGKGKGVGRLGGGVGTGKGTSKSMRTHLLKLPFSKLTFTFSPKSAGSTVRPNGIAAIADREKDLWINDAFRSRYRYRQK